MNQTKSNDATTHRKIVLAGLFAAMIALTTAYLFHIPIGANGGYIHLGDAFIYLAACLLPAPYACAAAAIGGGLADFMSGAAIWVLPTMIIKPLTALCLRQSNHIVTKRNVLGLVAAGVVCVVGYYFAQVILVGSWVAPLASVFGNIIQSVGSGLLFVVMGAALDKAGVVKRLTHVTQV